MTLTLTITETYYLISLLERAIDDIANYYGTDYARRDFGSEYPAAEAKAHAESAFAEKLLRQLGGVK
jgi:hypothetical protein